MTKDEIARDEYLEGIMNRAPAAPGKRAFVGTAVPAQDSTTFPDFVPDWDATWTPEEAADQIGFVFEGVGWYFDKYIDGDGEEHTDVALVMHARDQEKDGQARYKFFLYNDRSPLAVFRQIANMPVHGTRTRG